ncbi:MAG TPA: serine/threonine-protein kinase [Acidobacteriota bacterium]|nr:serine/threonine-protein kinase [Acidobacteriota bacterium]
MTPTEKQQKIKQILIESLQRTPDERETCLTFLCGDDDLLRQEIETLLTESSDEELTKNLWAEIAEQAIGLLRRSQERLLPGMKLHGRYLIEKEIGHGGIGVVYLARDVQVHERPVVIKMLLESSINNQWLKQKFQQESEALALIDHPGVVKVLDRGELSDGRPFIVMEYIKGDTLESSLCPKGMNLDQVAFIVRQIGQALSAAHDEGIVHRDLKPTNIMIQRLSGNARQIKLIDFGIAKVSQSSAHLVTDPVEAGTLAYMAIEQLLNAESSPLSDIYSFGVIAYEMVTGCRPFTPHQGAEPLAVRHLFVEMQKGLFGICRERYNMLW